MIEIFTRTRMEYFMLLVCILFTHEITVLDAHKDNLKEAGYLWLLGP